MTSTLRTFILGVILAVTTNSVTQAADRSITLKLGAGSTLEVERPFKTIMIGYPDIVDVHARSDRSVILEPLNPGATNLVFLDDRSIAITQRQNPRMQHRRDPCEVRRRSRLRIN